MKKIIIISLSAICLAACSSMQGNKEAIAGEVQDAKERISEYTTQELDRSKKEISDAVTSAISKADTTLTKKFQQVELSLNDKAEKTKQELSGKMQGIEDQITKTFAIGIIGIVIGVVGVLVAIMAYRKRPRTNVTRVKDLIAEEVKSNNNIRNEIRKIADSQSNSYRSQVNVLSQSSVERVIEAYIKSKKFKDILQQYIISCSIQSQSVVQTSKIDNVEKSITKTTCQLFAKESSSMILSSLQDTYQKGKSIFKLTMAESTAMTANVTLCIEQDEVKQRILKFDSQYLEPICVVTRSSNEPADVIIKSTGIAERIGDEWRVTKPITIEIR